MRLRIQNINKIKEADIALNGFDSEFGLSMIRVLCGRALVMLLFIS